MGENQTRQQLSQLVITIRRFMYKYHTIAATIHLFFIIISLCIFFKWVKYVKMVNLFFYFQIYEIQSSQRFQLNHVPVQHNEVISF